jgi:hypothetical protein
MNCLGIGILFARRIKAVEALALSSVDHARAVAHNLGKLLMLAYNNFNWRKDAYEVSQCHRRGFTDPNI